MNYVWRFFVQRKMKLVYVLSLLLYPLSIILTHMTGKLWVNESVSVVGGMLVQYGMVPHDDFWSMYPPLNYYLNAAVFSFLCQSVISVRILQSIFYGLVIAYIVRDPNKSFLGLSSFFPEQNPQKNV